MAVILVGRGEARLGMVKLDADGNVIKKTEPIWYPDPEGGSIAVVEFDPETMEQKEQATVYGDWQASLYLRRILDNPGREVVVEVDGWEIGESDIGKFVFLTREQAKAALKKKKEENI